METHANHRRRPERRRSLLYSRLRKHGWSAFLIGCAALLRTPAFGTIGPPVNATITTFDEVKIGQPMTVYIVIEALADVQNAQFELSTPQGQWKFESNQLKWALTLKTGEARQFTLVAVPAIDKPDPLKGRVDVQGFVPLEMQMDLSRAGGRRPEIGNEDPNAEKPNAREPEPRPKWEEALPVPDPLPTPEPRIPGKDNANAKALAAFRAASVVAPKNGATRNADATATATGRFVFLDDAGRTVAVRNATVELMDNDDPWFHEVCARGITDVNGLFSLTGRCGDLFGDLPDFYVRVVLNTSAVEVTPTDVFAGPYEFRSRQIENFAGGSLNFGTMFVNNTGAFQLHNLVTEAWQLMAGQGENLPHVRVEWPSLSTMYNGRIFVTRGGPFLEGDPFHEFGHHILATRAESPGPDYSNGICDSPSPGHCLWAPERNVISWTEGWPDFFAAVCLHLFSHDVDPVTRQDLTGKYAFENHIDDGFSGQEESIEGFIAAILWDLFDGGAADEDQHFDGGGRRDSAGGGIGFAPIWDVVRNFDPSGDIFHNHPTSIHEFFDGLRVRGRADINVVAEIYREHHIRKPLPDLVIGSLAEPPASSGAGASFTVAAAIANVGEATASRSSSLRFWFVSGAATTPLIGESIVGGSLAVGSSSTPTTTLTVPSTVVPGIYRLRACVDLGNTVPEDNEANNCRDSSGTVQIAGPDLLIDELRLATSAAVGAPVTVTAVVRNAGGGSVGGFYLDLYNAWAIPPSVREPGADYCRVSSLAAGATTTCTATFTYSAAGTYQVWAQVDTDQEIAEANDGNNLMGPRLLTVR